MQRINRPELWGPITTTDLLRSLQAEYSWACGEAARSGHHPSPAALIAYQELRKQYGGPLNPSGLPFHAKSIVKSLQTRGTH